MGKKKKRQGAAAAAEPPLPPAAVWIITAFLLEIYHGWSYLRLPQFWGEEGKYFFKEAYDAGLLSLWNTCRGYLHVYPRLTSLVATLLPIAYAPQIAMLAALLGQLFLFLLIWSPRMELAYWARVLCTLVVALNPNGGEVLISLTNVQWFMGPALIFVLLRTAPQNRRQLLQDAAWLVLLGFTGPYVVLFVPLILVARLLGKEPVTRLEWQRFGVAGAVALVHFAWWNTAERASEAVQANLSLDAWAGAFGNLLLPFLFSTVAPWMRAGVSWEWLVVAAVLLGLFVATLFPSAAAWRQPLRLALLLCGGICYAAGMWEARNAPQLLHPYGNGQRSFFILYLAVAWLLVLTLTDAHLPQTRRRLAAGLLTLSAAFSLYRFDLVMNRPDYHYAQQAQEFEQRGSQIVVHPPNWTFELRRERRWY